MVRWATPALVLAIGCGRVGYDPIDAAPDVGPDADRDSALPDVAADRGDDVIAPDLDADATTDATIDADADADADGSALRLLATWREPLFKQSSGLDRTRQSVPLQYVSTECDAQIGETTYYGNGESGTIDVGPADDADFAAFVACASDGIEQQLGLAVHDPSGRTSSFPASETMRFAGMPDLAGHTIAFVRITVHSMSIEPYLTDGATINADASAEIWGE